MPSGCVNMTVRQGSDRVTSSGNRDVTAPRRRQAPSTAAHTAADPDFRNGNVSFRRSCSDLRPPGGLGVKLGSGDLRLGCCDVTISTGDIILGTGEILRSNGEIWRVNTNQRTVSCQSLRGHTTIRRSRSGCVKGTGDLRHNNKGTKDPKHGSKGTRESKHNRTDNPHNSNNSNNTKQSRQRGRQEFAWNTNKHKNLRNRTENCTDSSSKQCVKSAPSGDWAAMPHPGPHIEPVRVAILSDDDPVTEVNHADPETLSDDTPKSDVTPDNVTPALDDVTQSEVTSEPSDTLCLCASSSSHALSSIDQTNAVSATATPAPGHDHDRRAATRTRSRMRRSQSDFLSSNRKLRRASISVEDGNVKVIMHHGAHTASSASVSVASLRDDIRRLEAGAGGDAKQTGSADDADDAPETEAASDSEPPTEGSPAPPAEIPKWKQRPHPLIPNPERLQRPWWEDTGDSEDDEMLPDSRRNDREEIRRKLAMGVDEEYYGGERMYKKPNLQTRLQSGMNLQICFMNEATSDVDSVNGDDPGCVKTQLAGVNNKTATQEEIIPTKPNQGNTEEKNTEVRSTDGHVTSNTKGPRKEEDEDFFAKQAKLQDEARMALAQVRPMAHMQLEVEKQMRKKSPIAEMVGIPALGAKKKLGRYLLSEMNVAQLQVVVNDLHSQIETLNEELVMMLVGRDDLHMEQDSMLVDIEDHHRRALEVAARMNKPKRTNKKK